MTTQEFRNIESHIGKVVTFKYTSLVNGKEVVNRGIITKVYWDCIILENESQDVASVAHYTDVYLD